MLEGVYHFMVKYPKDDFTLVELKNIYYRVQYNNKRLVSSDNFFFLRNIIPLIEERETYYRFCFPISFFKADLTHRDFIQFFDLWSSRHNDQMIFTPSNRYVFLYGMEPGYVVLDNSQSLTNFPPLRRP
jgi:hypothetical protein